MQMKENNETKIGVIDPYWDEIELKIHIETKRGLHFHVTFVALLIFKYFPVILGLTGFVNFSLNKYFTKDLTDLTFHCHLIKLSIHNSRLMTHECQWPSMDSCSVQCEIWDEQKFHN